MNTDQNERPFKPEILAPVGNWDMCLAAVHNGAGAIYVGMPGFNARARSYDHNFDELEKIINYCHLFGVKVHIAFNILIFQQELKVALQGLLKLLALKPDAIICQDVGLARMIKKLCPQQVIHASTQMTISSAEHIEFLSDLHMDRYVLARENSLKEMANIRSKTDKELEVFVHGALCVAYSGQCLTSESMGGRSANRGQCAQSCRLDYQLKVNDEVKDLGAKKYLVSPKDLFAIDMVKDLMDLKVDSFKIEGRYKPAEYVAQAAKAYSSEVDKQLGVETLEIVDPEDLRISFSRDFFSGWMHGVDHNQLVDGRFSGHRGLKIGAVSQVLSGKKYPTLSIRCDRDILAGDGLMFVDADEQMIAGGKAFEVNRGRQGEFVVSFDKSFDLNALYSGAEVYINRSPVLDKQVQQSWKDKQKLKRIGLSIEVSAVENRPLLVKARDEDGHSVELSSSSELTVAQNVALDEAKVLKHFNALGGSIFKLCQHKIDIQGQLFISDKEVKTLRRKVTESLEMQRLQKDTVGLLTPEEMNEWIDMELAAVTHDHVIDASPSLNILIREEEQLDALKGLAIDTVYLDYKYGQRYQKSVDKIRAMGFKAGIVTTRVFKAGKEKLLGIIDRIQPDVVLMRNAGAFQYFINKYGNNMPFELTGDFSFNITNHLAANYFLKKGLNTITPSYDLNFNQLKDLLAQGLAQSAEITIHQYMPSFHMEHCVFASFLSDGSSIKDCGMPCLNNNLEIVDKKAVGHPVLADQECRNTMFNGTPQSAASLIPDLLMLGVNSFRVEALSEDADTLRQKVTAYLALIKGDTDAKTLYKKLGIIEKYGISEGQQQNLNVYNDRKKT